MPTSERYRQSAVECRRLAVHTQDAVERETLLRTAKRWERVADHRARKELEGTGPLT
jgi:hypothetical protein